MANQSPNCRTRVSAAKALLSCDEVERGFSILRDISTNRGIEDWDRRVAAQVLGRAGDADFAISALLELMGDAGTHKAIACYAAGNLIEFGQGPIGLEFLVEAAQPGNPCILCERTSCGCGQLLVIETLSNAGERQTAVSLLTNLLQIQVMKSYARTNCAVKLAEYGNPHLATSILLEVLHSLPAGDRALPLSALGKWGEKNQVVLNELLAIALDENAGRHERSTAIQAIGDFGNCDSRVLESLAEIAQTSTEILGEANLKISVCSALRELTGPPGFVPPRSA